MLQAGNLKKIGLEKLLGSAEQEKRSGILFIRGHKGIGSVTLEKGLIIQAESPVMPRRIGRILVDTGVLMEKQLQQALKTQEEAGKKSPLGEILIRLGFVDASKLKEIIRLQILDSIHSMLNWREGVFRFEDQEVLATTDILLSPQEVMAQTPAYAQRSAQVQAMIEAEASLESPSTPDLLAEDKTGKLKEEIDSMITRVTDRLKSMEPKQAVVLVED